LTKTILNKLIQYSFLLILILFLFIGGPQLFDTRSFKNFWDLGHIGLFALMTFIFLKDSIWLNTKKKYHQLILIIVFTVILGGLIEAIQLVIGRTFEFIDIWRGIVGSLIAFVFFNKFSKKNKLAIYIAKFIVLSLFIIAAWPLTKSITDEIQAQLDFPLIADFENIFEIEKWYGQSNISLNEEVVLHGKYSLKVELLIKKYSGIQINYFPTYWQNYTALKFNVYSASKEKFRLTCRVLDKEHNNQFNDWFTKSFYVQQGWNEITINLEEVINAPADRIMDIRKIKNFALFAVRLKEKKIIYFDYLRLE